MSDNQKAVAKSLHTITVLQQVAKLHIATGAFTANGIPNNAGAIALAMETLGLAGRPDPYGLAERALKFLDAAA